MEEGWGIKLSKPVCLLVSLSGGWVVVVVAVVVVAVAVAVVWARLG